MTLTDLVAERLARLSHALELETDLVLATFRDLVGSWADHPPTTWRSEISDDNTPIELSIAFDRDDAALRILFEPQATEPTLEAHREAGLALHARLEESFGVDLSRFSRVSDLFLPPTMTGSFAVWSSVVFASGARPTFKAYLNPNAQGAACGPRLVEEALDRLGLHHAWSNLCEVATQRGPHLDEIKYFALDLSPDAHARVKIYVHHHNASARDLEEACKRSQNHQPGHIHAFARALCGGEDAMSVRAPFTCHAFSSASSQRAITTAYVPVCAYAIDDAMVANRFLAHAGDQPVYRRAVIEGAHRPLDAGVGLQSWIAARPDGSRTRHTVYIATEARRIHPPGTIPAPTSDPLAVSTRDLLAERPLDEHPLLRRLAAQPVDSAARTHRAAWRALDELYHSLVNA